MAYRKTGYYVIPEGAYMPATADDLWRTLTPEKAVPAIAEALDSMGSKRRFLEGIRLPDILKIETERFAPGTPVHKQMVLLTYKVLHHAGYIKDDIPRVEYTEDPVLTIKDAVGYMLTQDLPWPTRDQLGGEKATLETLSTHLPIAVRELRYAERLRGEYYARLRLALGNIGYKVAKSLPITQNEKTFFTIYADVEPNAPGDALGPVAGTEGFSTIPAVQNADPLVTEAFARYAASTETGPGLKYFQLLSNRNMEQLVMYYGLYARTLPLSIGYEAPIGPFTEHRLQALDSLSWTPNDQMTGIRDLFADTKLSSAAMAKIEAATGKPEAKGLSYSQISWVLNAPTRICGYEGKSCAPMFIDFPDVTLRLDDEQNCAKYQFEYYSKWRQRPMLSTQGATPEGMMVDIALQLERSGEAQVANLNIDSFGVADFADSARARKVVYQNERIMEDIYYVREGTALQKASIDMTDHYTRQGTVSYRPAFAEQLIPPRMWFFKPDPKVESFIASRLGLNNDQAFRNRMALTISHNVAMLTRVLGFAPAFDTEKVIKAIMNINT